MNTALKSICFFACSVILGNWLSQYLAFQTPVELTMESWFDGKDMLPARIVFSGILSLPVLIPIVLVFGLIKTYRAYFPLNILVSTILGFLISLMWSLVLALIFYWFRDIGAWTAFVGGVVGAAAVTELLSTIISRLLDLGKANFQFNED